MSLVLIRLFLFLLITGLILAGFWQIALMLILGASFIYNPYEFLVMAFCVDCYYTTTPVTFWYTLVVLLVICGGFILRPFLRAIDSENI